MSTEERKITIRMPAKLLKKWLKALRSGEFKQAKGKLYNPTTQGFCCLGVLQHCASGGSVEYNKRKGKYMCLPSHEWLQANKIEFYDHDGYVVVNPALPGCQLFGGTAATANDHGINFKTIAAAIEQCAEGV